MSRIHTLGRTFLTPLAILLFIGAAPAQTETTSLPEQLGINRGICVVWNPVDVSLPLQIARESELLVYVQTDDRTQLKTIQSRAEKAGLLGVRIYAEFDDGSQIHLADNFADVAILGSSLSLDDVAIRDEALRVLHPGARVIAGGKTLTKPRPKGADDWSHPYHSPDNNPQSRDENARAPYLTQFLSEPWYVPMPQVTVASGGRVFKAFGHIALKEREQPWLNKLVAINGFNGTQLWKRDLKPGFMVHRNTLVATPETLFLADDVSCKLIDPASGETHDEIIIPKDVDEGGVWKWLAISDGTLFALVGPAEPYDQVIRGNRRQAGWPWSGLGKGYAGKYAWGFGRTLLAIDPKTKKILWSQQSESPIDGRAMCLDAGKIYLYSHQNFLSALDAKSGEELWKTTEKRLLEAIGEHDHAQNPRLGFASSSYAKANEHGVYFAGPQRTQLVAVSAKDGSVMWDYPHGNFQLVLRGDGLYALGRMETSKKFDYLSGSIIADLECYRGNCTRATGTVDSIFTRGYRHTGTMRLDVSTNEPKRIPLMRPACQDGVIISDGMLYWGPWMCDCNHSLVGMIALAPAGDFDYAQQATNAERREIFTQTDSSPKLSVDNKDWTHYRSGSARHGETPVTAPNTVKTAWRYTPPSKAEPTAPVTVGNLTIWSGADGVVRAAETNSGTVRWTSATGGAVKFPPEIFNGRAYVGSGDGYIYCLDASSGEQLWRFRAAPSHRKLLVHGRLLSNWPVGSGVLVEDGVVYAAAGIASYDGTHIYALDADDGSIKWQNNTSGHLVADDLVTGVSVQGHLLLHDKTLFLAGGNVVSPAKYDIADGSCLNELKTEWLDLPEGSRERFPTDAKSSMFKRSPRGRELFLVDGEVRVFDQLLYSPPKQGPSRYFGGHFLQAESDSSTVRATTGRIVRISNENTDGDKPVGLWESDLIYDPLAMALAPNAVVVAGRLADERSKKGTTVDDYPENEAYAVAAFNIDDGSLLWSVDLPVAPVSWGMAVDRSGSIILTLTNGEVLAIGKK